MSAVIDNANGGIYETYKIRQKSSGKFSTGSIPVYFVDNYGAEYKSLGTAVALITKLKSYQNKYASYGWVDINDLEVVKVTTVVSKVITQMYSYDELSKKKK